MLVLLNIMCEKVISHETTKVLLYKADLRSLSSYIFFFFFFFKSLSILNSWTSSSYRKEKVSEGVDGERRGLERKGGSIGWWRKEKVKGRRPKQRCFGSLVGQNNVFVTHKLFSLPPPRHMI